MKRSTLVIFNLISIALVLFVASKTAGYLHEAGAADIVVGSALLIETLILYFISFAFIDGWYNRKTPMELRTVDDGKPWWKSKMFWLAALSFVMVVVNGITGKDVIDQSLIEQILNLDWSNLVIALTSLVMIVVRKYFTFFPLKKQ